MKLLKLSDLFNEILSYVKRERHKNKNFDGLKFWRSIKPILSNSVYKAKSWKSTPKQYYSKIMLLPEYYINGSGKTNIIEENHFLIQTVRIPKTESPSLRKIMQVALNIGQYMGHNTESLMKRTNIKDYLNSKDSDVILSDILSNVDIKKLEKKLS